MPTTVEGVGVTPRTGHGTAFWYRPDAAELPEDAEADDPDAELERFHEAQAEAEQELEAQREETAANIGASEAEIFDAHVQFLNDPEIVGNVEELISQGKRAEHAVKDGFAEPIKRLENMEGIMAERGDDLRDIRDRLLRILTGTAHPDLSELPPGTVVIAERLTPSDTAQLDAENVAGFVTASGGKTSHAAIIARSLGIPAVVGVGDGVDAIGDGDTVVVDGETGKVTVDPGDDLIAAVEEQEAAPVVREDVETRDGMRIEVAANIGTAAEIENAVEQGADGIGLFRTEFLYLNRREPPSEEEQYEAFVQALAAFPDDRVVVRTIDIGGDKPIPYLDLPEEENPFLGNRGIRFALTDGRDLFETQLRALLRAAATEHGDNLHVMFPLVATVEEVRRAKAVVDEMAGELAEEDVDHAVPDLGIMVETPATVLAARELAREVDFMSIGTNDLIQYIMAASRGNKAVAELHDPLHPAVVRAITMTVDAAHEEGIWAGMCGEMAGEARLTELLVGLGLDELSMSPYVVPSVKAEVRDISEAEAKDLADSVIEAGDRDAVARLVDGDAAR